MDSQFFRPKKINISENLILVPYFPNRECLKTIESGSVKKRSIFRSVLYSYSNYDILYGFLGYSNLLTILEFISDVRNKNIFFLGTAGSLDPGVIEPKILNVTKIYPGSIFRYFSSIEFYNLYRYEGNEVESVVGISEDLIQRENPVWYKNVMKTNVKIVEMELFPLRWYIGKEITALVVVSDQISISGIKNLDRKRIAEESARGFKLIMEKINET